MNVEKLVHMANQIAAFFRAYPEDQARAGIRDHLVAFWTPKMRAALLAHADRDSSGLDRLASDALLRLSAAESPIRKEVAGPEAEGGLASDAG